MSEEFITAVARAVVGLATRQCRAKPCGAEAKLAGRGHRHLRCPDCPLDDVDEVSDRLWQPSEDAA